MVGQIHRRDLARGCIGEDLDDLAGLNGNETVYLQDREIGFVERRRRHGRRRDHRHLGSNARIDDEVLPSRGCDRFRDLRDVRVLEIRRNAPGLLCGSDGHHRDQHRRAADKETKTIH